ncbi:MAG: cbb3-type cytochrome c oxidase subunit 3 [Leptospiraceae bacterium]|nr:cbb3-type cytochrome c oxidase subunit 3 [Leptospiraceae bacterium]
MDDQVMSALMIYKSLRLPVMILAICYITFYLYSKKRKEAVETPKYRMLDED